MLLRTPCYLYRTVGNQGVDVQRLWGASCILNGGCIGKILGYRFLVSGISGYQVILDRKSGNYLILDRISSGDWCIWLKATIFFPRSLIDPPIK